MLAIQLELLDQGHKTLALSCLLYCKNGRLLMMLLCAAVVFVVSVQFLSLLVGESGGEGELKLC